jgi:predicted metal-dependent RNase
VFAFGKTQEALLMIHELREQGVLPTVPVHIGGLSTRMSQIADKFSHSPHRFHRGYRLLDSFPDLHVLARGQREPEFQAGRIYALSSGMMSEHTVSNRFARRILASEKNSLFFIGYADSETPGGKILEAGQGGSVRLDSSRDRETPIRCEIQRFDFSGHSPREQIADYAVACSPENVILVHGDPAAKAWFEVELKKRLPQSRIINPLPGEIHEL